MTDVREAVKLHIEAKLGKAFEKCSSPTDVCERGNCWCNVLVEELVDAALAALDAAGWQCVPKEATREMLAAAQQYAMSKTYGGDDPNGAQFRYYEQWNAMLTAAPKVKP